MKRSLCAMISITVALLLLGSGCKSTERFSKKDVKSAQKVLGLDFGEQAIDTMYGYLQRNLRGYDSLRAYTLPHETFPALLFDPHPQGYEMPMIDDGLDVEIPTDVGLPDDLDEVAFYTIPQLASLLRNGRITSVQLTQLYLDRLKRHNPTLQCAITITEERALEQAAKADAEIKQGKYRSLLHGIPYGTKDLMSVAGYKTTWGARPYKDQEIDHTATVIHMLDDAGAILVAKLTSGALARGDVWFGGQTMNPWDPLQGASGSSAGSGSATSAGLVAFSLGTETLGSITSPSTRNGVSGLRPTYGRVSRDGVMSLSWSMDKVGPICRSAEDCAIVFAAIEGADPLDKTTVEVGYNYSHDYDLGDLKVAILQDLIDKDTTDSGDNVRAAVKLLRRMGISPDTISLPTKYPYAAFDVILRTESGAMFDELVRSGQVDRMVQQSPFSRANSLRQSRFVPAVEYLQANRYRTLLIEEVNDLFEEYDVIITPTFGGQQLVITNLTGHPVATVPTGFDDEGHPTSISFLGNLYQESVILQFADAYQRATEHHLKRPPLFVD